MFSVIQPRVNDLLVLSSRDCKLCPEIERDVRYLIVDEKCKTRELIKRRSAYFDGMKAKQFKSAADSIHGMLKDCASFLSDEDIRVLADNFAHSNAKAGGHQNCISSLKESIDPKIISDSALELTSICSQ